MAYHSIALARMGAPSLRCSLVRVVAHQTGHGMCFLIGYAQNSCPLTGPSWRTKAAWRMCGSEDSAQISQQQQNVVEEVLRNILRASLEEQAWPNGREPVTTYLMVY